MKMSLVVLTEGKLLGKSIPITLSQFIIGRDPQCQLRPASALISKRHCAVIVRGAKIFVRDFDSTNGTFVNDEPVKGEREVKHDDTLKVGPLTFRVVVEGASVPVNKPTPLPQVLADQTGEDDSVAAMLLDLADEGKPQTPGEEKVPDGSTTMETIAGVGPEGTIAEGDTKTQQAAKPAAKAPDKKKANDGDTSAAAQAILQKYMRRQRS
jgi:pSer/pThr/pTyr-binding forkhead associated (FHA) protein